jgi:hypothetical protein
MTYSVCDHVWIHDTPANQLQKPLTKTQLSNSSDHQCLYQQNGILDRFNILQFHKYNCPWAGAGLVVESLASKCKALGSIPSTHKVIVT